MCSCLCFLRMKRCRRRSCFSQKCASQPFRHNTPSATCTSHRRATNGVSNGPSTQTGDLHASGRLQATRSAAAVLWPSDAPGTYTCESGSRWARFGCVGNGAANLTLSAPDARDPNVPSQWPREGSPTVAGNRTAAGFVRWGQTVPHLAVHDADPLAVNAARIQVQARKGFMEL